MKNQTIDTFLTQLASSSPTPGGGGAASLCASMGASLLSMVCNLTIGKPKYAENEEEVKTIRNLALDLKERFLQLSKDDEVAFEPLSKAYSLPTSTDEEKAYKEKIMEECLVGAASVPLEVVEQLAFASGLAKRLSPICSRLAVSDVGVAASFFKAALNSAALNVYINTKMMKNEDAARSLNERCEALVTKGTALCEETENEIKALLKKY